MKKIISMILAVLMLASLGTAALAEEGNTFEIPECGMTLTLPGEMDALKGVFYPYPIGEIAYGTDLFYFTAYYFGMTEAEFNEIMSKAELTDEEKVLLGQAQGDLQTVIACKDGKSLEEIESILEEVGMEGFADTAELIGSGEGYNFYCSFAVDEDYVAGLAPEYAEEYRMIVSALDEALKNADFYEPEHTGMELVGKTVSFETTDLDGNPVSSEEIFAQNEITMINIWATWCGPCKGELAELAEINTRLQEVNCGIIGIVTDGNEEGKVEVAKALMEENGTNYLNILPMEDFDDLFEIAGFPSSYFVDSKGTILATPVVGAEIDAYEKTIHTLLAGEEPAIVSAPTASANGADVYRVHVGDKDGNPVQGVAIQFCSDTECNIGKTDAEGVASFSVPEGISYTVHVLKVPEGYEKNNNEYPTLDVYSDITIVIDKAA